MSLSRLRHGVAMLMVSSVALVGAGCGAGDKVEGSGGAPEITSSEEALPEALAGAPVKVALVRQLGSGDYFEQWLDGARAMAKALNIDLVVSDAQNRNDREASNFQQVMNRKDIKGIIVDHGLADTMNPLIDEAVGKGMPVVAVDVETDNEEVPSIQQSDVELGEMIAGEMAKALNGKGKVGYVYVAGYAPLDRRDRGWETVKKENPGLEQVAQFGKVSDSTASDTQQQAEAVLAANEDLDAVLAPYDEFAKGVVLAINQANRQKAVKVYGVDISTPDIGVMIAPDSPWVATAATDPFNGGAVAVRTMALKLAGETPPHELLIPPTLITQEFLREEGIKNMNQLREALPDLNTKDVSTAPWMPEIG